jgi:hypothetical protein
MFYFGISEKQNENKCDSPPEIIHGEFRPPQELWHSSSNEAEYAVGAELQAVCEPSFSLNCPSHGAPLCGKIVCNQAGSWISKDGSQFNCIAEAAPSSRDIRSEDGKSICSLYIYLEKLADSYERTYEKKLKLYECNNSNQFYFRTL